MKKKSAFIIILVLLLIAVAVTFIAGALHPVRLAERFPQLKRARSFQAELILSPEESSPSPVSGPGAARVFTSAELRRAAEEELSFPAFSLRPAGSESFCVRAAQDGQVSVSFIKNSGEVREFYSDGGSLFQALYKLHLKGGGRPLP